MAFIHSLLAADMENERKGRVKPDILSESERNSIIKLGIESEMKKAEKLYWFRVGVLMAGGLTKEQAREKIYQDVVGKGDLKMAKTFRDFQNKVDPLKAGDELPPTSPHQPPSST